MMDAGAVREREKERKREREKERAKGGENGYLPNFSSALSS